MRSLFPAHVWPRIALAIFSVVCAVQAAWIVAPEFQRPRTIRIPLDAQAASRARPEQDRAERAASLAIVRGDLWAESGFTYADLLWSDAAQGGVVNDTARADLERALKYSPHRGDVWLMLAALVDRYKSPTPLPSALLKMSFYTAPNELILLPQRLMLSFRVQGIEDPDTQDMIKRDLRKLLSRTPDSKSVLVAAYKKALPGNRPFIERIVSEVDPLLAKTMHSESR